MSLRELPLNPNTAVLADVVAAVADDEEPASGEASNNQLLVSAIFLLAPGIGQRVARIQADAALDVLRKQGNTSIENVRHFIARVLLHELFLLGVGFVSAVRDHISA